MIKTVPDGDTHERTVCGHCGFVNYVNPKIVVGSVVRHDGKILLSEKHRVALSPDGHGGSLLAMSETGMLEDMADRGVEHIS